MSRISFDNYGRLASSDHSFTVVAGRYAGQEAAEEKIPQDVRGKLDLNSSDDLLEIGCGTGNILIPLFPHVNTATGIDHPAIIERMGQRHNEAGVKGIAGNFFDLEIDGQFDKVLIYSVLHNLSDEDEAARFIDKALGLLKAGGKMLVGDIPNQNLKDRFLSSPEGQDFVEQWQKKMEVTPTPDLGLPDDPKTVTFDDAFMNRIIAAMEDRNFDCFVLSQPSALPFGHTRQDLLIESRE